MKVKGKHYRSVWMEGTTVYLIEQNKLPFEFAIYEAKSFTDTCHAIKTMITRGAGAIGAAAGFAMAQAASEANPKEYEADLNHAKKYIESTRPTAYDLFFTVEKVYTAALKSIDEAHNVAQVMANLNAEAGRKIGEFGADLISNNTRILTHCNAGWLAFVDYGSALSPVYVAQEQGKNIFVYADETRPRSQGARLTAWELLNQDVDHAIIPDNAAAYYMSEGKIDMLITGADRIAANGDVANKIGTLEKAIAAKYYGIPFYVTAPISTIDPNTLTGNDIDIEQRSEDEVTKVTGPDLHQNFHTIYITNPGSSVLNPAFDVTPADFVTGIITEKGIIKATKEAIAQLLNS